MCMLADLEENKAVLSGRASTHTVFFIYKTNIHLLLHVIPTQVDKVSQSLSSSRQGGT